jgi:HD-like signal output (HDOD) protein
MEVLKGIIPDGIPTLPIFVQQLTETLEEDFFTAQDLERIISQDAALSARILRIANSALFGLPAMVGTLSHAIVLLGTKFIHVLALSIPLIDSVMYKKSGGPIQWESYWTHSFACAWACSNSVKAGYCSGTKEEAFICGLLHDIGKPILWTYLSDGYREVIKRIEEGECELVEVEKEILGIDHAEVGGELTNLWNFPETISVAIASHHDVFIEDQDIVAVQLGDYIANAAGLSDFTRTEDALPPLSDQVVDCISEGVLDDFVHELKNQGDEISGLVKLL